MKHSSGNSDYWCPSSYFEGFSFNITRRSVDLLLRSKAEFPDLSEVLLTLPYNIHITYNIWPKKKNKRQTNHKPQPGIQN